MNLNEKLSRILKGYSIVKYQGKKYGLSRTDFNEGRSTKIYAEELGGNDVISFNFYRTAKGELLKTCEMPKQKVFEFLEGMETV